jgi:sec-independent protein translocase protein TatC
MRLLPRRLQHGEEATVVEHLGELRSRIVFCLIAVAVAFGVTYAFHGQLLDWLNRPLPTDPETHKKIIPVTLSVTEPFMTSFWISLWAAFVLALPVILWQLWGFFAPAFQKGVQRVVAAFSLFSALLLAAGVLFGYFVVMKPAIHFLTSYDHTHYNIQIQAKSYYPFVMLVLLACAIVFELPIFMLAMARIGILPADRLRRNRRLGYVIVAAVAVALPGVDPVTTTLEMIPLMILFELSIWMIVFFDKRWKAKAAAADAAWEREYNETLGFDSVEADAI